MTDMEDGRSVDERQTTARTAIKNELPRMYDAFWTECDEGRYFDIAISSAPMNRLKPRNLLLRSGSDSLRWSYGSFIERAAMALAADKVANLIDDERLANYYRFRIRNPEALGALRGYFRFLDQATYHLSEVSDRKLIRVERPRDVSFQRLEKAAARGALRGSRRLVDAGRRLVETARSTFTSEGWSVIRALRNVDTHRYVVGIDHISYNFRSSTQEDVARGGRLFTIGDPRKPMYAFLGKPDIEFATLGQLLRLAMRNARMSVEYLARKRLLVVSDETG